MTWAVDATKYADEVIYARHQPPNGMRRSEPGWTGTTPRWPRRVRPGLCPVRYGGDRWPVDPPPNTRNSTGSYRPDEAGTTPDLAKVGPTFLRSVPAGVDRTEHNRKVDTLCNCCLTMSRMRLLPYVPPLKTLARAAAIIAVAAVPVVAAWWLLEEHAARSVYRGMTFMVAAVTQVALARQFVAGSLVGLAALAGALIADNILLLLVAVVVACSVQWFFNQWSAGLVALLPSIIFTYSLSAPSHPMRIAVMAWLGAAIAIGAASLVKVRREPRPADMGVAARHVLALAAGCIGLILLNEAMGFPHGNWAVLTFCLVFVPLAKETTARVKNRVLGTAAGAVVAASIAVAAPRVVCLVLAVVCAVLTVAYAIMPEKDLFYTVFLTPTIILLYGASKFGLEVLGLAGERVGLTALGGLLAIVLTVTIVRPGRAARPPGGEPA